MSSEHQRIERIRRVFERPSADVLLGIGDDCAVLAPRAHPSVWSVDSAVEGVHFSLSFMRHDQVGYRAFMAAASDLAAMGARATAALCALHLPRSVSEDELDQLLSGLAAASDAVALPIVGGNLARASELSLSISVVGHCVGPVLKREGARVGDGIFVTGSLGGAALGLAALRAGEAADGDYREAIARFLRPLARLDVSQQVAGLASAGLDISDGLAQDLSHLCKASGVGAVVHAAQLPVLPHFAELAQRRGLSPDALALAGGEDYELMFTAEPGVVPASLAVQVGSITSGASVRVVDAHGHELPHVAGFDHFR